MHASRWQTRTAKATFPGHMDALPTSTPASVTPVMQQHLRFILKGPARKPTPRPTPDLSATSCCRPEAVGRISRKRSARPKINDHPNFYQIHLIKNPINSKSLFTPTSPNHEIHRPKPSNFIFRPNLDLSALRVIFFIFINRLT